MSVIARRSSFGGQSLVSITGEPWGAGDKQGRVSRKSNLVHPRLVCIVLYSGVVCCVVDVL